MLRRFLSAYRAVVFSLLILALTAYSLSILFTWLDV